MNKAAAKQMKICEAAALFLSVEEVMITFSVSESGMIRQSVIFDVVLVQELFPFRREFCVHDNAVQL